MLLPACMLGICSKSIGKERKRVKAEGLEHKLSPSPGYFTIIMFLTFGAP